MVLTGDAAFEANESDRDEESDSHAGGHELDDVEQDHADDAQARGAERDAHGDFARPGRDHQSDDAVDAQCGQQQRSRRRRCRRTPTD